MLLCWESCGVLVNNEINVAGRLGQGFHFCSLPHVVWGHRFHSLFMSYMCYNSSAVILGLFRLGVFVVFFLCCFFSVKLSI